MGGARFLLAALLSAALAGLVCPATLTAQVPDTTGRAEPGEAPGAGPAPEPAPGPDSIPAYMPPRAAFSLTVSTFGFKTLQIQPVQVYRIDGAGAVLDSAALERSVETEGGFQLGAAGLLSFGPVWAIRVGGALGRATIRPKYAGDAVLFELAARGLEEEVEITAVSAEAALRMRLISSRRAQPYLELGAAATHWRSDAAFPGASELANGALRVGGMAALGVDLPFSDHLAGRAQATTRVFRTPVSPAPLGAEGARGATISMAFQPAPAGAFADGGQELTTSVSLEVGLSLGIGRVERAPTDPVAPAESPSPPAS